MTSQRSDFTRLLDGRWAADRFLCIGLDTNEASLGVVPSATVPGLGAQARFNCAIIDATHDVVCAYKPNAAFYEARGLPGLADLQETIRYIHVVAPDVPVILDAKRADIGNTNRGYAEFAFEILDADAITVHPYLGAEALQPFLSRRDRGVFVLCRTSNPGAGEFQDLRVGSGQRSLFETVAMQVASAWNTNGNCGLVVGATYPNELATVRELAPDLPILIPGIGAQGGDLELSVHAGLTSDGDGIVVNASRSIIFASTGDDFASAARAEALRLDDAIREAARSRPS